MSRSLSRQYTSLLIKSPSTLQQQMFQYMFIFLKREGLNFVPINI